MPSVKAIKHSGVVAFLTALV